MFTNKHCRLDSLCPLLTDGRNASVAMLWCFWKEKIHKKAKYFKNNVLTFIDVEI